MVRQLTAEGVDVVAVARNTEPLSGLDRMTPVAVDLAEPDGPGQLVAKAIDLWLGDSGVAATVGAATGTGADAIRDDAVAGMPTGRFTTPEEVATIVALLCSGRTANVTGSNWVIDDGLVKTT